MKKLGLLHQLAQLMNAKTLREKLKCQLSEHVEDKKGDNVIADMENISVFWK